MLKTIAAAAAFMIAAGAVAVAQQPPAAGPDGGRRPFFAAEDHAAFLDARIAALRAGLRLTSEQEKAWPAFEQAYRDLAALRGQQRPEGSEEWLDPVERIKRKAEALSSHGAALKRYADALEPLYKSLDDGQKRRFGFLSRPGHAFRHFSFWRGGDRGDFRGPRRGFGDGPAPGPGPGRGEPDGPPR
jgi:zinc resistance-associated protein